MGCFCFVFEKKRKIDFTISTKMQSHTNRKSNFVKEKNWRT